MKYSFGILTILFSTFVNEGDILAHDRVPLALQLPVEELLQEAGVRIRPRASSARLSTNRLNIPIPDSR